VKTIMAGMGFAMMGTGIAEGQNRAIEAARKAISSPLLEGASVNGARGVIINVTGGSDLSLVEVSEASLIVQEAADEDANIIFGAVIDPALNGRVKITVIATGFGSHASARTSSAAAQTPVDMTSYNETARAPIEMPPLAATASGERLTLRRQAPVRRRIEMPLPAAGGSPASLPGAMLPPPNLADIDASLEALEGDPGSAFDVPAFLRRQEG
jgi:cell division protein FtsZ